MTVFVIGRRHSTGGCLWRDRLGAAAELAVDGGGGPGQRRALGAVAIHGQRFSAVSSAEGDHGAAQGTRQSRPCLFRYPILLPNFCRMSIARLVLFQACLMPRYVAEPLCLC